MNRFVNYTKSLFQSRIGFYTAIFVAIYFASWIGNGMYSTHFDLINLRDTYFFVLSQLNIAHFTNSVFNSPRSVMPNIKQN